MAGSSRSGPPRPPVASSFVCIHGEDHHRVGLSFHLWSTATVAPPLGVAASSMPSLVSVPRVMAGSMPSQVATTSLGRPACRESR
jgi:hypothetical protein